MPPNTVWHKCLMVQNFDESIGVIGDFDKENFDECVCLPVKRVMVLLLLYYIPLLPLSLLLTMFHTPQHTHTLYRINILKDQVTIFWYAELFLLMVQLISKLTLASAEHTCVLQFLSWHTRLKRMWNACDKQWAASVQYFVHCMSAIFVCHTPVVKLHASHFLVCCTRVIVELIPWFTG